MNLFRELAYMNVSMVTTFDPKSKGWLEGIKKEQSVFAPSKSQASKASSRRDLVRVIKPIHIAYRYEEPRGL